MKLKISLVIPSYNPGSSLNYLFENIKNWTAYPSEIILIDSSITRPEISENFKMFLDKETISFKEIFDENLFPGKARNIGIKDSSYETVAFLDVLTIPPRDWLKENYEKLTQLNIDGVWGSTSYDASLYFTKIVRACTYGVLPIRTLPGSILKKSVFESSGLFIETTRAGEDADWIERVKLHRLPLSDSSQTLSYIGLENIKFIDLIKKWHRNYFFSSKLPYLTPHKDIYFYFAALFMIVLAFNWNTLSYDPAMNGWNTASFAYIPNVTKISILFFTFFYITVRGIYLPLKKGINIMFILVNLPAILFISLILDFVKSLAFLTSRMLLKKSDSN